jgi:hypothetical protein
VTVKLNHTIVAARDHKASALFVSALLGLPPPVLLGPFALVTVGDELTLDFMHTDDEIRPQHYAFLVSEAEFDEIFGRIKTRGMSYWPIPRSESRTRSTAGTTAAASTSRISTGTFWRS